MFLSSKPGLIIIIITNPEIYTYHITDFLNNKSYYKQHISTYLLCVSIKLNELLIIEINLKCNIATYLSTTSEEFKFISTQLN